MKTTLFTASQIAAGLDLSRRAVAKRLRKTPCVAVVVVRGKETDAWEILSLPQEWIRALDKAAEQNGFGNAEQFLSAIESREPKNPQNQKLTVKYPLRPEGISGIAAILEASCHLVTLSRSDREGIWNLAVGRYHELLCEGLSAKRAAKTIVGDLARQVPQLCGSREALRKTLQYNLAKDSAFDRRRNNGNRFKPPQEDVDLLRHSAFKKNGGRLDAAWQEEYPQLSDYTQGRYPLSFAMPDAMRRLVNPEITAALTDAEQGRRKLKKRVGGVERDWSSMPSMHLWIMDDLTTNLEVSLVRDGIESIVQPQIVAVMDSPSRKFVGYAISPHKAPNAELVCAAMLDAVKKTNGVPRKLGLENGFVFGGALNVNGKVDEQGRTIVAGLGRYGCSIAHFNKMNPQSKGELEKGFDLLLRHLERHPGYTGRNQMLNAPDKFKREQRLIRSGKIEATDVRYTYEEFCATVAPRWFETYNSTPRECLGGLSPNQEFERRWPHNNPPISFTPELLWYFAKDRYRVRVKTGGVSFTHFGKRIRVRGAPLANVEFLNTELWALMEGPNDDLVTFLQLDFRNPFTMQICKKTLPDELAVAPQSRVLAGEQQKIGQHMAAVYQERDRLVKQFGNTRHDLLADVRAVPVRPIQVAGPIVESVAQMEGQRAEIRAQQKSEQKERQRTNRIASAAGVHPAAVADPEKLKRITELLNND